MSELAAQYPTVADKVKQLDPDGKPAKRFAQMMMQSNQLMDDAVITECNDGSYHQVTQNIALPTVALRSLNGGTVPTYGRDAQQVYRTSMFDSWLQVDPAVAAYKGGKDEYLYRLGLGHTEAMGQSVASYVFYGNALTDTKSFTGFALFYNALTGNLSQQVIDGGGSGSDMFDVWLVSWGSHGAELIYPQGTLAGLQKDDKGVETVENAGGVTGALMDAHRIHYMWSVGLALNDPRYVVRVANIDKSELVAGTGVDITEKMRHAYFRLPAQNMGRTCWYMNRTVMQYLTDQRYQAMQTGGQLEQRLVVDASGKENVVYFFMGYPIRIIDQLVEGSSIS